MKFQLFTLKTENFVILLISKEKNVTEEEVHYFSETGKQSNNGHFLLFLNLSFCSYLHILCFKLSLYWVYIEFILSKYIEIFESCLFIIFPESRTLKCLKGARNCIWKVKVKFVINEDTDLCGYLVSSCLTFFWEFNETQKTLWNQEADFRGKRKVYRKIIKVELVLRGLYLWKCFLSQDSGSRGDAFVQHKVFGNIYNSFPFSTNGYQLFCLIVEEDVLFPVIVKGKNILTLSTAGK